MTATHWIPMWKDKFNHVFNICVVVGGLLVLFIGFAAFWQAAGARTERAFVAAEKYEAIEYCKKDGLTAFVHVETGKVICGGGSLRSKK